MHVIVTYCPGNKAGLITGDVADLEKHLEDENDIIRNGVYFCLSLIISMTCSEEVRSLRMLLYS